MIEFRAVSKRFHDGTVAVDDFNAVMPSRKTTVLVGSSGSGKTTLLRMINRMVDPTAGAIEIDGDSVLDRDPVKLRRSIGYVMQNSGLLPHFKVIDNVATVPVLNGVPRAEARKQALELLDTVGLERSVADRYPNQLSGGQQQRVGVARGLAANPNILLMDEPFGAVETDDIHEFERPLLGLVFGHAGQSRDGRDVVDHPAVRKQARVLHDVADSATQLHRLDRRDVFVIDEDRPARRVDHAVDHAQHRGLAGPARSDQNGDLVGGQFEREVVDRQGAICEAFRDGAELDHGSLCSSSPGLPGSPGAPDRRASRQSNTIRHDRQSGL